MTSTTAPAAARWTTFALERYAPLSHGVMAAAFAIGNAGAAASITGRTADAFHPVRVIAAVVLVMAFFFRLRIFDEVKDYTTDIVENPGRPLPRGLLTVSEARRAAWVTAAAELVMASVAGVAGISAWTIAFLYSLAMYREFGIGPWLRPRLELYAITHTLVAAPLGITVCCIVLGTGPGSLPAGLWGFTLVNWALFNVFEFSRKTFAPSEERPGVESYSSRLGHVAAAVLTLVPACAALGLVVIVGILPWSGAATLFGAAAGILVAPYMVRPARSTARLLRRSMTAWAAALYFVIGISAIRGA